MPDETNWELWLSFTLPKMIRGFKRDTNGQLYVEGYIDIPLLAQEIGFKLKQPKKADY